MPEKTAELLDCGGEVKNAVIIGNGPSAISLSYMLAGYWPYYQGTAQDEYLHRRLQTNQEKSILVQNIEELAMGCEGRSNNPVSVFFDMLNHPDADTGIETESLLSWKEEKDRKVDHLIIGKGRPGGCWESLDGDVQTVSFGSWMELPNLKLSDVAKTGGENAESARVKVSDVAKYYQNYVKLKGLDQYFMNHSEVTSVREITSLQCSQLKRDIKSVPNLRQRTLSEGEGNAMFQQESLYDDQMHGTSPLSVESNDTSCHCTTSTTESSVPSSYSSSSPDPMKNFTPSSSLQLARSCLSTTPHGMFIQSRYLAQLERCSNIDECSARDGDLEEMFMDNYCCSWDPIVNPVLFCRMSGNSGYGSVTRDRSASMSSARVNSISQRTCHVSTCFPNTDRLFEVTGFTQSDDLGTGFKRKPFKYLAKRIVLATGSYDFHNRLNIPGENLPFVLHSLNDLESMISRGVLGPDSDPVLIIGAGLSAADAIVTANNESIPAIHAFRKSVDDSSLIFRRLPKILYPEYHQVYRLMRGEERNQTYQPYQGYQVTEILSNRLASLKRGDESTTLSVSFVLILIGSSPDLDFLEPKLRSSLGIIKKLPISRNNPIDIDLFTNEAVDVPGVYAMGPLVGDNFVRFLQGGALAITADILKKEQL